MISSDRSIMLWRCFGKFSKAFHWKTGRNFWSKKYVDTGISRPFIWQISIWIINLSCLQVCDRLLSWAIAWFPISWTYVLHTKVNAATEIMFWYLFNASINFTHYYSSGFLFLFEIFFCFTYHFTTPSPKV